MLRLCRSLRKIQIPPARITKLFSRGSGNGGQNLHASNSRCMIKFNIHDSDWLPKNVKHTFLQHFGAQYVTAKGNVVIVREDTRSAKDNEKLAFEELQGMLDKCETWAAEADERAANSVVYATELEKVKASKTKEQQQRYVESMLRAKRMRSLVKQGRQRQWMW